MRINPLQHNQCPMQVIVRRHSLGTAFADFTGLVRNTEGTRSALALGVCGGGAGSNFNFIWKRGDKYCEEAQRW